MAEAPPQRPIPYAQRRAEEISGHVIAPSRDATEANISADAHHIAQCAREDANHIVKHMWGIFVLLPIMLVILWVLLK
jgi:hypothetical protein